MYLNLRTKLIFIAVDHSGIVSGRELTKRDGFHVSNSTMNNIVDMHAIYLIMIFTCRFLCGYPSCLRFVHITISAVRPRRFVAIIT